MPDMENIKVLPGETERPAGTRRVEGPGAVPQAGNLPDAEHATARRRGQILEDCGEAETAGGAFENALNGLDVAVCVTVPETGEILFLNDKLRGLFGVDTNYAGQYCYKLLMGLDGRCEQCPCRRLEAEPDKTVVWEDPEAAGEGETFRKTARLIDWTPGKKAHLAYGIDISDHVREQKRLERILDDVEFEMNDYHRVPLTAICSRRYFEENIESQIDALSRAAGTLSLMIADIDCFRQFNDIYGRIEGDECLRIVAEVLRDCTRPDGYYAARYDGDKFVVVLPNTDAAGARKIADKMLSDVWERNILHPKNTAADRVTVSVGIASGRVRRTHRRDDYLRRADEMLCKSKRNGRNRYTYTEF